MFFFRVLELEEQIKKEKDQADLLLEQQRVVMLLLRVLWSIVCLTNWLLVLLNFVEFFIQSYETRLQELQRKVMKY